MSHTSAWFPCYVNDLLGSMRWKTMTPAQRGAYWQLICWQMQSDDGTLPGEISTLSTLADLDLSNGNGCVVDAFPLLESGRRANPRAATEWHKRKAISAVRSTVGKDGIAKRWQLNSKRNSKRIANATTTTTTTTTTGTTTSLNTESVSRWQAMLDKYRSLGVDVDREKAKAEAWILSPRGRGRKFTEKFFANWLARAVSDTAMVERTGGHADPDNDPLLRFANKTGKLGEN